MRGGSQEVTISRQLSLERFESCLANRSRSENPDANHGHRPQKFLPNILSYSGGSLDRFGNAKTPSGAVPGAPRYRRASLSKIPNI